MDISFNNLHASYLRPIGVTGKTTAIEVSDIHFSACLDDIKMDRSSAVHFSSHVGNCCRDIHIYFFLHLLFFSYFFLLFSSIWIKQNYNDDISEQSKPSRKLRLEFPIKV